MRSKNKFMAYYNGKKIFSIVKTVEEHPPVYEGDYTITENGTYNTGGKKMEGDLIVNVASSSKNTLKTLLDATKKCYQLFYRYGGTSVDDLISYEDTSNVNDMRYMFYVCEKITSIPLLNTSNVTNMKSMFEECSSLTSIPLFDTSNVIDMSSMFCDCENLTEIPSFDTSNVTNMVQMFQNCRRLISIPLLNTSNVTDMSSMFFHCENLTEIPSFDMRKVTRISGAFTSCYNLTEIHMTGMKADFDIHDSTKFTRDALLEIINNCQDLTGKTSRRITMGSNNLAKLTDEDKLIATNKNWTLA